MLPFSLHGRCRILMVVTWIADQDLSFELCVDLSPISAFCEWMFLTGQSHSQMHLMFLQQWKHISTEVSLPSGKDFAVQSLYKFISVFISVGLLGHSESHCFYYVQIFIVLVVGRPVYSEHWFHTWSLPDWVRLDLMVLYFSSQSEACCFWPLGVDIWDSWVWSLSVIGPLISAQSWVQYLQAPNEFLLV